jgi:hypothetical protein
VKICSGRFSAGLGAAVSWRGLMIGGGGSTANRAAAEVIGDCCAPAPAPWPEPAPDPELEPDNDDEPDEDPGAPDEDPSKLACCGRGSTGLLGVALDRLARGAIGAIGRGAIGDGAAAVIGRPVPVAAPGASGPRKSLTRVSTSWLIEMLLVSQKAFSRSYVVRLTLMLRRVCFLAMIQSLRYG